MVAYIPPTRQLTPTLDIGPWLDGSGKADVARRFDRISREIGFFYLTGHGVSPEEMQTMLDFTARFFAIEDAAKLALRVGPTRRGYEPFGQQTLDAGSPPDIKESYLLGFGQPPDHPMVRRGLANYGPNQWPEEAQLPGFAAFSQSFMDRVYDLGRVLMAIFANVAGLPEDYFEPMLVDPMATLRLVHYPPQPGRVVDNQIGCGAHTDWGAVTLLLQDDAGGLEVQAANGEWLHAPPLPGAFVVNLGDMMPVWTNGAYHSNMHRVRNANPERHRYSAPLFIDPHYDALIECLPAFAAGEPPSRAPRTVGEHIDLMYAASYGLAT